MPRRHVNPRSRRGRTRQPGTSLGEDEKTPEAYPRLLQRLRKRWGVQIDEWDEFRALRNRVVQAVNLTASSALKKAAAEGLADHLAFILGNEPDLNERRVKDSKTGNAELWFITDVLEEADSREELATRLEILLAVMTDYGCDGLDDLGEKLCLACELTPSVGLRIPQTSGRPRVCRAGAKVLDDKLITDVLEWLSEHPKAEEHYAKALSLYLSGKPRVYRNLLDDLRFALEQLIRDLLGNKRPLEKQTEPLLRWLKANGAHQGCVDLYQRLLAGFTSYQNDAVKHGDRSSAVEVEFMVYLTGAFMRFLLQIAATSEASAAKAEAVVRKTEELIESVSGALKDARKPEL